MIFIIIFSIILFLIYFINRKSKLSFNTIINLIFLGIGIQFIGHFITIMLTLFISYEKINADYQKMTQDSTYQKIIITIILVGIIGPIIEEYIFRKIIQTKLNYKFNIKIALILQSLIFAMMHFNLYQFFPTLIHGFIFGFSYYKYKSLYPPIILHMFNNIYAIIGLSSNINEIYFQTASAIFLFIGLYRLKLIKFPKNSIKNSKNIKNQ